VSLSFPAFVELNARYMEVLMSYSFLYRTEKLELIITAELTVVSISGIKRGCHPLGR